MQPATICNNGHVLLIPRKNCCLIRELIRTAIALRNSSLPHTVQFGVLPGIMGPPATPTHAITQPITFVGNKILFYPEGIIQAGAIYLKDTKNRVQYALSSGVSTVSYLRKYQYTGGEWKLLS